ncbi:MAG: hypothetical protein ACLQVJ_06635 [Syntrophobacteraceae bacterium]
MLRLDVYERAKNTNIRREIAAAVHMQVACAGHLKNPSSRNAREVTFSQEIPNLYQFSDEF